MARLLHWALRAVLVVLVLGLSGVLDVLGGILCGNSIFTVLSIGFEVSLGIKVGSHEVNGIAHGLHLLRAKRRLLRALGRRGMIILAALVLLGILRTIGILGVLGILHILRILRILKTLRILRILGILCNLDILSILDVVLVF